MKLKPIKRRLYALGTVCALTSLSFVNAQPVMINAEAAEQELVYDDFEDGEIGGYIARGEETVEVSSEEAYSGNYSLKISNRTETWNGPMVDKSEELSLGETYTFSVAIKYDGNSLPQSKNFSLQLQYSDGVEDQYKNMKTGTVNKGSWTILTGEYTIPTDAQDIKLYIETAWTSNPSQDDLMDFYIDDFKAVPASMPEIQNNILSLKDVFSNYFIIGGASTASEISSKTAKSLFKKHYNSITFGNELKPDYVLDYNATVSYMDENDGDETNPQVSLRAAKTLLEFARDNHIPVRGHTLVWHSQTPDWFFKVGYSKDNNAQWVSKEVMLKRMENYIKNLMEALEEQYPTVDFYAWDVVNEAIEPNNSNGYRSPGSNNISNGSSAWMQTIGSDFIVKAFEYARKYAPEGCKLFYNDYNEYESRKMDYIYNVLVTLKEKGLVDGMGMQSHWIMEYPSISMFETAVKKYDSLGLEIQLTEVDMKNPDNSSYALEQQATRYKQWMDKAVELKKAGCNITAVIFWGITDATSWLGGYPLLFDGDYQAKPAYYSIIRDYAGEVPTGTPTPTVKPTATPTAKPTATPTVKPTATPTVKPTAIPTVTPTVAPTATPTVKPTAIPTATPTIAPTATPTATPIPSNPSKVDVTTDLQARVDGNTVRMRFSVSANEDVDVSKLQIVCKADNILSSKQNFFCDHAAIFCNVSPWYLPLTQSVNGVIDNQSITVSLDKSTILPKGGSMTIEARAAKEDWSNYNSSDTITYEVYYDNTRIQ